MSHNKEGNRSHRKLFAINSVAGSMLPHRMISFQLGDLRSLCLRSSNSRIISLPENSPAQIRLDLPDAILETHQSVASHLWMTEHSKTPVHACFLPRHV